MIDLSDAARVSGISRRKLLRTGLFAGVGVVTAGAGLMSMGTAASADVDIQALSWQLDWKWCRKCQGMFYGPAAASSRCPAGNTHDATGSYPYYHFYANDAPLIGMQPNWRWCRKCQGLAYAGNGPGWCPGSGRHDHTGSFNYHIWHDRAPGAFEQDNWRWCNKCQALFWGPNQGSSWCGDSDRHYGGASYNYLIKY